MNTTKFERHNAHWPLAAATHYRPYCNNILLVIAIRADMVAHGNYSTTRKDVKSCAKEIHTNHY